MGFCVMPGRWQEAAVTQSSHALEYAEFQTKGAPIVIFLADPDCWFCKKSDLPIQTSADPNFFAHFQL